MSAPVLPDVPEPTPLDGLRDFKWLGEQSFCPLRWAVTGLIPEGMSLLIGGPKLGKSWLSLDIAIAVASGGRALGAVEVGPPRPVLLLALEDGDRRLQNRARMLLGDRGWPERLQYLTRLPVGATVFDVVRAWLDTLDGREPPLVILDTLGKVLLPTMAGESPYSRDYRVAGNLKRLADDVPGMALLVLHHDRKAGSEDFVEGVSGTNGIAGAADTITVLTRPRNAKAGLLKVTGRDVEEKEYQLHFADGRWTLAGGDLNAAAKAASTAHVVDGLGARSEAMLRLAADRPDGIRAADVSEALGIDQKQAGVYLRRAANANRLIRMDRGLYLAPSVVLEALEVLEGDPE